LTGDFPDEKRLGFTNQMSARSRFYLIECRGRKFTPIAHGFRSVRRNRDRIAVRSRFPNYDAASAKDDRAERLQSDLRGS
jgi:hypothetical protein